MNYTPTPTPGSETSVYFDAPIVNFSSNNNNMSDNAHAPASPILMNGSPKAANGSTMGSPGKKTRAALSDANGTTMPASQSGDVKSSVADDDDGYEDIDEEDEDRILPHPNGSSGWLPATDLPDQSPSNGNKTASSNGRRSSVLRKASRRSSRARSPMSRARSLSRAASVGYAASTTSSSGGGGARRSLYTNSDGRVVNGSAFISGAGTTGPDAHATPDPSLHQRRASAASALTPKQNKKIAKKEAQDGKSLTKVIRQEAKVEKRAIGVVIQELSDLQRMQKDAVKREAKSHAAHVKAVTAHQKAEEVYIAARVKYETSLAEMNAFQEALDISRENARKATEAMQEKSQEVDAIRTMYGVDEREREVKITSLTPKKTGWFS
ncbi:hypothetical protein BD626DRAFT_491790 [Schizophyllum amplum]|uniref:DNA binding protein Ncp1 n=1 Tax=Schizophyllum amplum TaxID=97359 RepID=A0A550CI01_9AGAR|nr:hypothetical protein BD626DRAFT_491790 [Auriculariopsis ampla]